MACFARCGRVFGGIGTFTTCGCGVDLFGMNNNSNCGCHQNCNRCAQPRCEDARDRNDHCGCTNDRERDRCD